MLTGKCKTDFEKWYSCADVSNIDDEQIQLCMEQRFNYLSISKKYGVYQDFFDTVDLEIVVFVWRNKFVATVYEYEKSNRIGDPIGKDKGFKTREQARIEVINKANKLYNDRNNN